MKNKNVVLYGVIALVAVVAIAFFTGRIPPKNDVQGTIGGANRYQSEQISEQDVVLKDPQVQAFLQSDLFHKLQTNPELAKDLANPDFARSMRNVEFSKIMLDQKAAVAVQTDAFRNVMRVEGIKALLSDPQFNQLLIAADAAKVTTTQEWAKVAAAGQFDEMRKRQIWALAGDALAQVCANDAARQIFRAPEQLAVVTSAEFLNMVASGDLARQHWLAYGTEFSKAMASQEFQKFLAADGMRSRAMQPVPTN